MKKLLALFAPEAGWLVFGGAIAFLTLVLGMGLLGLSGVVVAGITFSPVILRLLALSRTLSRYAERLSTHAAIFRALARLRLWFFAKAIPLAPARLGLGRGGDLLNRITADIDALDALYLRILLPLGLLACTETVGLWLVGTLAPQLALAFGFALALLLLALVLFVYRRARKASADAVVQLGELRTHVVDGIEAMGELLANDAAPRQQADIARATSSLVRSQLTISRAAAKGTACVTITTTCLVLLALTLAPASHLVPLLFSVLILSELLAQLPQAFLSIGRLESAATRVFGIAERAPAVSEPATPLPLPESIAVRFENVSLSYDRPTPALSNISFSIAAGERVMVLGPSGSGKSSLAGLLLKFWPLQSGRITLGETDIASLAGDAVRSRIGYLSQRTLLLSGTVRDNLLLAAPAASEDSLWQALKDVELDDTIRALPQGLDTWTGEGGLLLSGGQARRLALAQIVLRNAPLWLLDEPTEGLDAPTAEAVCTTLARLSRTHTVIFITHQPDLAVPMNLTRILRLENGHLAADS